MDVSALNFSQWSQFLSDTTVSNYLACQLSASGTVQKIKVFASKTVMQKEGFVKMPFSNIATLTNQLEAQGHLKDRNATVSSLKALSQRKANKILRAQNNAQSILIKVIKVIAQICCNWLYRIIDNWQKNIAAHREEIKRFNTFTDVFSESLKVPNFTEHMQKISGVPTAEEIQECFTDWMEIAGFESRFEIPEKLVKQLMTDELFESRAQKIAKWGISARSKDTHLQFSESEKINLSTLIPGIVDLFYKDFERGEAFQIVSNKKVANFKMSDKVLASGSIERKIISLASHLSHLCDSLSESENDKLWFKVIQAMACQGLFLFNTAKLIKDLKFASIEHKALEFKMDQMRIPSKITLIRNLISNEIQRLEVDYLLHVHVKTGDGIPFMKATSASHFIVEMNKKGQFEIPLSSISRNFNYTLLNQ